MGRTLQKRDEAGNPWDRLPNETARAFHAFCLYRDLPPDDRSLTAVAKITGRDTTNGEGKVRAPRCLFIWSSRYKWVDRSNAYDEHMQRIAIEEEERQLRRDIVDSFKFKREYRRRNQRAYFKIESLIDAFIESGQSLSAKDIRELTLARERACIIGEKGWAGLPGSPDDTNDVPPADVAAELTAVLAKHALRRHHAGRRAGSYEDPIDVESRSLGLE